MRSVLRRFGISPRAWVDALLTYPRFLGRIKPSLMGKTENEVKARLTSLQGRWEVRKLQVPVGKRILVLSPHPDDEAIGAGGLLLAHQGKAELHFLLMFDGSGGGNPETRRREFELVTQRLGAKSVETLALPDGAPFPNEKGVHRLREHCLKIKPDVVLLPWFLDAQTDHQTANRLFAEACSDLNCMVLGYEIWGLCQPNAVFDFTGLTREKESLIGLYPSQVSDIDYAGYIEAVNRVRAFQFGNRAKREGAVEGFFSLPCADYCDLVKSLHREADR